MTENTTYTPRRYRFPAILGEDGPVIESVDPASLAALPADEIRALFEAAGFVIVRLPGGLRGDEPGTTYLSLEGEDSLEDAEVPEVSSS